MRRGGVGMLLGTDALAVGTVPGFLVTVVSGQWQEPRKRN
jgi:hypothetical protein